MGCKVKSAGFSNWILPHSAPLMGFIGATSISYGKWFKYFWKLFLLWNALAMALLFIAQLMNYGPF